MPYVVCIGQPDKDEPTFTLPFWTRRAADREVALARTKRGVGFIVTPYVRLPGRVYPEGQFLWANRCRVSWLDCLRRKWDGGSYRLPEGWDR